ncbi:hypothetical protein D3C80_1303910 [compost metagenome]
MRKIDFLIGFVIGLVAAFLGVYLYITLIAKYEFVDGVLLLKKGGFLGKLIALGAVFSLAIFFMLLRFNKELMAKGVILATFAVAVLTFLV